MDTLTISDFQKMLTTALGNIEVRADEFSRLDAVIGDGDHGTAIVAALNAAVEVSDNGAADFKTMLSDMGFNIMLKTSGSTSTLLGGFFLGMSDAVDDTQLNISQVKKMFAGGLEGVRKQTKAQVGDKTMMDSLVPATQAIEDSQAIDIVQMMAAAAAAAVKGSEATVGMKANFGRARNYGDKSVGHADSGASSWACMFESFAQALESV